MIPVTVRYSNSLDNVKRNENLYVHGEHEYFELCNFVIGL